MSALAFNQAGLPNYVEIDHHINTLDIEAINARTMLDSPNDRVHKVIAIFRSLRPLLTAITALPLIPNRWRAAVQLFVVALDALSADGAAGDFKAGKDL
jgi:hypothetical protein